MQDSPRYGDDPDKSHTWTSAWTRALAAHAVALVWAAHACLAAGWAASVLTGGSWLTADEPRWVAIAAAAVAGTFTWALTHRIVTEHIKEFREEFRQEFRQELENKTRKDRGLEPRTKPPRGGRNTDRVTRKDQRRRTRAGQPR